jgi:hypothetical protein
LAIVFAAAALLTAVAGGAQQPPAVETTPLAAAVGVVVDSLRGGPLGGATVVVSDQAWRQTTTDSAGRFWIDSIPPGSHRLAVFHPLLDTLDIGVVSQPIRFAPGETVRATIATPSPAALLGQACASDSAAAAAMALEPTELLGRVLSAADEAPVGGATVMLAWSDVQASKNHGITQRTLRRDAVTDAGGRFRLCGPPGVTQAALRATQGAAATGWITVVLSRGGVVFPILHLSSATDGSVPRRGDAIATGRVVGTRAEPVVGATVEVIGAASSTRTNDNGTFTLRALPEGTQNLSVRAAGYATTTLPVDLAAGKAWQGVVQLPAAPPTLSTVRISAQRLATGYASLGFAERKRRGIGTFLTADDIERKQPLTTTDVFENIPGIYVDHSFHPPILVGSRGKTSILGASGVCVNLIIDGHPVMLQPPPAADAGGPQQAFVPLQIDEYVALVEIAAVEVYNPSETPLRFETSGTSCQTIVIWTKGAILDASAQPSKK